MRRITPLAVACLAALGFAAEDARERVILGAEGLEPGSALPAGQSRGGFELGPAGLVLATPVYYGWNYLLPEGTTFSDGFVRARFVAGRRLDSTLMMRASVPVKEPMALEGLGLSLEDGQLVAYRFTRGVARPLGYETDIKWEPGQVLELTVLLSGPHIAASVVDGSTLSPLGSLHFTDRKHTGGGVGVRVHSGQDTDSSLQLLAILPAGAEPAQTQSVPRRSAGKERLVVIGAADLPRVPTDAYRTKIVDGERVFLVTDPTGAERIRRSGVAVLEERSDPGWWFYDKTLRAAKAEGPKRTRAGFDIDDSYKDAEMVEAILRAYHARFPEITSLEELGRTHEGRPVLAIKVSDNAREDEDEPAVIFNASHHGSELMATEFALDALKWLTEGYKRDRQARRIVDELEVWIVPMVNPDGNMHYVHDTRESGRKNGRDLNGDGTYQHWEGVDLNRNYPFKWGALGEFGSRSFGPHSKYRGEGPASEPEVQALMALYLRERPASSISFHTAATKVLTPYTIDGVRNTEPDIALTVAEEMAAAMPMQTSRKMYEVARNLYSVDGTDQDWMFHATGALAFLIEGPLHNVRSSRLRRRSVERTRPGWQHLLERTRSGPRIYGTVTNGQGMPLEAAVRVAEIKTFEGERWTARRRDGRFDRMLGEPGTYTIVAELDGYQTARRRVRVEGALRVDLRLEEEVGQ